MRGLRPPTLRLRAEAEADYAIVAACLQDALMPMSEMTFLPGEKRFATHPGPRSRNLVEEIGNLLRALAP